MAIGMYILSTIDVVEDGLLERRTPALKRSAETVRQSTLSDELLHLIAETIG